MYNIENYASFVCFFLVFVFILLSIAITTLYERKVMASMQRRRGPNIAGYNGFLQAIADGLKLFTKELIFPTNSNKILFFLSPVFTFFCSITTWLFLPTFKDNVIINPSYSMLYLLAISSLSVYGIIFSGWSSNSKYAFLGGVRSTAQMISYEVCITFIWLAVCLLGNSLNLIEVVKMQEYTVWFILPLFPFYIIFIILALAETNRAPFDLAEAEAELVAGYNTEYSSIAFALFFLGEYSNIISMSVIATIFFWGGWIPILYLSSNYSIFCFLWFGIKVSCHIFIFIWVRATLPRYRYDQLMKLGWKNLMPFLASLIVLISIIHLIIEHFFLFDHTFTSIWWEGAHYGWKFTEINNDYLLLYQLCILYYDVF